MYYDRHKLLLLPSNIDRWVVYAQGGVLGVCNLTHLVTIELKFC